MRKDITLNGECAGCATPYQVSGVEEEDFVAWKIGKPAQDAFPYLSVDERELLISGICDKCWQRIFPPEEEEEELVEA